LITSAVERAAIAAILIAYLAVGALYATRIPPYNAPDEPAHANYARDIGEHARLPVLQAGDWNADLLERLKSTHFPPGSDVSTIRYESHQPPLYYLYLAPVAAATGGLGDRGQLVAMRLATLPVGAAALVALYACALALFPGDPACRVVAVALAAFVPMHVAVGASVSNDAAAELMLSLVLWRCLVAVRRGLATRDALLLGALIGLGMLTKLSCYVALPLAAIATLLARPDDASVLSATGAPSASIWRLRALRLATVYAVAGAIAAPWLIRGAVVYGTLDPLGLARHDDVVRGQPLTGIVTLAALRQHATTLFHSFWGQFGWMGVLMDERVYLALGAFSLLVGVGLLLGFLPWGGWRRLAPIERRGFALAVLLVLGVLMGTVGYNLTYLQPQGRYLFPAMSGIATLAAAGLRELIGGRQRAPVYAAIAVAMVGLDLLALVRFIVPALAS
jgi:4-amino-4-deoxy-L-arabinose transferase-like glycosyltransferase